MSQSFKLPVVGMHFRPPAKAILSCLPSGARLWLEPEPTNPYDQNAVKVLVHATEIPPSQHDILDSAALPFGSSAREIFEKEDWHLGYIPRDVAEKIIDQVVEHITLNGQLTGTLSFDAKGKPLVAFLLSPEA